MRSYRTFSYKDSNFRVCCTAFDVVTSEIRRLRGVLEAYIARQDEFRTAMVPLGLLPDAPPIVRRMHRASVRTGVGPMAAVAGTIAQMAAEAALGTGAPEAIVENGGDIYVASDHPVTVALYAGRSACGPGLAFALDPARLPLAVCSSSSRMGHSTSLGNCDLATVVAPDASLADAAATLACNLVTSTDSIQPTLERVGNIAGVNGVLIATDGRVGMLGNLPELVRNADGKTERKVTRDPRSSDT